RRWSTGTAILFERNFEANVDPSVERERVLPDIALPVREGRVEIRRSADEDAPYRDHAVRHHINGNTREIRQDRFDPPFAEEVLAGLQLARRRRGVRQRYSFEQFRRSPSKGDLCFIFDRNSHTAQLKATGREAAVL